jgi:bacteriocin biosynthesis cyclodehydratase domain-containing protein
MDAERRERYSRQILFDEIGEQGQERLCASSVVLIGCGALGTALANLLVRAGVGRLRIVDRDFVEPSNLQRQALFEEADASEALPKAVAAQRRLGAINSDVKVDGVVADLSPANIEDLLGGFPLLLDGTDNFETRLLVNDYAVSRSVPWVYAAVVGSYGLTMAIEPGQTACLACLTESPESGRNGAPAAAGAPDAEPTCETVGVLGAAAGVIAAIEAASALKFLLGKSRAAESRLVSYDVWTGRFQSVRPRRDPSCRACGQRRFPYLEGEEQPHLTMCGRDSVQIHERRRRLDLPGLGERLSVAGSEVRYNEYLLRFRVAAYEITVFADGRAIIKGTRDPAVARSLYARYIGS